MINGGTSKVVDILFYTAAVSLIIFNAFVFLQNFVFNENFGRRIQVKPTQTIREKLKEDKAYENSFSLFREIPRHIPPPPPEINYTKEELNEAIIGLNLPTWSRSYVPCNDSRSEVTCSQVVKAWRCLDGWAKYIESHPFENRKHLQMEHLYDGVGNRFSTDTTAFIVALMLNRSFIVKGNYPSGRKWVKGQAFNFHKDVLLREGQVDEYFNKVGENIKINIQTFDMWYNYNFTQMDHNQVLYIDFLLYATMAYTHGQLSEFCREHFGMHAPYFICNFLMKLPDKAISAAKKAYSNVPANVRVFGVHLRFQMPGQFYSYNVSTTIRVVIPFLKKKLQEQPTIFAFASDSQEMEAAFKRHFKNHMFTVDTIRIADYDHDSALNDIAMLEMADELLISYRSTFSYVCAMRMGKRAWFVEKEAPGVFQVSNSQTTAISALFHNWDVNDWQTNRRVHVNKYNEEALRYYFKYFIL